MEGRPEPAAHWPVLSAETNPDPDPSHPTVPAVLPDGIDWRVAEADHRQGVGQPQILSHFLKVSCASDVWASPGLLFWAALRGGALAGPMGAAATASCPLHFVLPRAGCAPSKAILLC